MRAAPEHSLLLCEAAAAAQLLRAAENMVGQLPPRGQAWAATGDAGTRRDGTAQSAYLVTQAPPPIGLRQVSTCSRQQAFSRPDRSMVKPCAVPDLPFRSGDGSRASSQMQQGIQAASADGNAVRAAFHLISSS